MNRIRDPRDRRKWLTMVQSFARLGRDCTVWTGKDLMYSVYRSQDAPRSEYWVHGLSKGDVGDYTPY